LEKKGVKKHIILPMVFFKKGLRNLKKLESLESLNIVDKSLFQVG